MSIYVFKVGLSNDSRFLVIVFLATNNALIRYLSRLTNQSNQCIQSI